MGHSLIIAALSLACCWVGAGDQPAEVSLAEQVNAAALRFEEGLARQFVATEGALQRWHAGRRASAVAGLADLLARAKAEDRLFVAFHLLRLDARHQVARQAFTGVGVEPPFDEAGRSVGTWKGAASRNAEVVEKVCELGYPPLRAVYEVVALKSLTTASYWTAKDAALRKLVAEMLAFAKQGQEELVYPMLAYYEPELPEVKAYYGGKGRRPPRQRWWVNHVERFLLDRESMFIDGELHAPASGPKPKRPGPAGRPGKGGYRYDGTTTWVFNEVVGDCRLETLLGPGQPVITLADAQGRGVSVAVHGRQVLVTAQPSRAKLAEHRLDEAPSASPVLIGLELHGAAVSLQVFGVAVATAELDQDLAYQRFTVAGHGAIAHLMRVRFLPGAATGGALIAGVKPPVTTPSAPPASEPWRAERERQLAKPVSFAFEDTPVEDAIALLGRLGGVAITLDERGKLLRDLPITLKAKDLTLKSALDWVRRVSDLTYAPTVEGFTITWPK